MEGVVSVDGDSALTAGVEIKVLVTKKVAAVSKSLNPLVFIIVCSCVEVLKDPTKATTVNSESFARKSHFGKNRKWRTGCISIFANS
jgi:hypothetical protein